MATKSDKMKEGKGKYIYLFGCCALVAVSIFIFYPENKRVLEKVAEICSSGQKQLKLNQVTDFEWDTVYIQYGLSTEFMYEDYNLSGIGEDNVTESYGLSLYFIRNGKGVYMENHEEYTRTSPAVTAVVHQPPIYVEFDDLFFESHKGKRDRISISAIFNNNTNLTINIRDIYGDKICTVTGGIGDVSGIYPGG
jgi:hypothetical protein